MASSPELVQDATSSFTCLKFVLQDLATLGKLLAHSFNFLGAALFMYMAETVNKLSFIIQLVPVMPHGKAMESIAHLTRGGFLIPLLRLLLRDAVL